MLQAEQRRSIHITLPEHVEEADGQIDRLIIPNLAGDIMQDTIARPLVRRKTAPPS